MRANVRLPHVLIVLLGIVATLTLPAAVHAQTPTPATNDATSIPLDPAMVLALVLVLLLLALFALAEIFRYLRDGREDYYKTFREFARRGVYVEPVLVNATAAQAARGCGTRHISESMDSRSARVSRTWSGVHAAAG